MHLILIGDIHLAQSTNDSFGIDTKANFERVIVRIEEHDPDHVVIMGDFSLKAPMREDVEYACKRLTEIGVAFSFIAGNHDRSQDLAQICSGAPLLRDGELFYSKEIGGSTCIFLDTAKGFMNETQRLWLAAEVKDNDSPTLVFMHHPPIKMGVPFMDDNHGFKDADREVFAALFGGELPVHVFSGHYHTARSAQVGMHSVHLCPSTYFQLDPFEKEFAVSHTMPGMRHVEVKGDILHTWIEFLPKKE